ncbi:acyl-CoA N-acyltransferase [Trametes coccinea BRFM310]|uniref:histone acetyltransferase n=1 Tax=Trametes coccinea (strain BRFM310) TaxID=1353009 RepID=A0A1Y2IX12_TRAC3|nr:acyl-CoA N-acyltransferase [Trametes coccinea BRFM310]
MPKTIHAAEPRVVDRELVLVNKNGAEQQAHVLERHGDDVYVHYVNTDKRMDEWVSQRDVKPAATHEAEAASNGISGRKRKRESVEGELAKLPNGSPSHSETKPQHAGSAQPEDSGAAVVTEEEYDIQHHKQITAKRNFDKVVFGRWQIKTWYFSPYPLTESEADDKEAGTPSAQTPHSASKIPGVSRSSIRSHGRTSDLLAGGLGRSHGTGQHSTLWVCDRCFKYMADGLSWELHVKKCTRRSPPGRKVYQRGAHIIWEVDGAKEKLYCQNLSLFGKLFIDIKTLFFDCDNFLFYILTDADSQRDHVLGFFSKEKVSYDDYNLACIVVLPPYQKKGYGMLLIEFSYELSRRAGKIGTPERPLSDLGLRSYLTYWISTLVRFFRCVPSLCAEESERLSKRGRTTRRRLLSVLPPETAQLVATGPTADVSDLFVQSPARDTEDGSSSVSRSKRRKSTKGWDGEEIPASAIARQATAHMSDMNDPMWTSLRTLETTAHADGSATTHVVVRCTLADVAGATNLRVEDAAFALNECGLLIRRRTERVPAPAPALAPAEGDGAEAHEPPAGVRVREEDVVVVTREMVEAVAKARDVKRMCLDLHHVLL